MVTLAWAGLTAGRGLGKLYSGKKRGLQVCPDSGILELRSPRGANKKWGILCDWLEVHIWLSLVAPKLKAGTKIREAVSFYLSPGHLKPTCYRTCLASWTITGVSSPTSSSSDF